MMGIKKVVTKKQEHPRLVNEIASLGIFNWPMDITYRSREKNSSHDWMTLTLCLGVTDTKSVWSAASNGRGNRNGCHAGQLTLSYSPFRNQNVHQEILFFIQNQ